MDACLHEAISAPEVVVSGVVLDKVVRLSTESMAWYGLCLQSWSAGLQPGSKKKKHTVPDSITGALQAAIQSFCSQIESLSSWATDRLSKKHDADSLSAPGHLLRSLTAGLDKENSRPKLWDTLRKDVIDCQRATLVGIRDSCNTRLQAMKSLKF